MTPAEAEIDILNGVALLLDYIADWAETEIDDGKPPKWVIRELVIRQRKIAAAARGEAVTP